MTTANTTKTPARKRTAEKTAQELNAERLGTKVDENIVEIEDDLKVEVIIKPTDMRLAFVLRRFKKLNKYADNLSDEQADELLDVILELVELLISKDDLERVTDYYVAKTGEFSVDAMSNMIEKVFGANEKK
jgi:hypothetical protein